jgi:hypothetical protein
MVCWLSKFHSNRGPCTFSPLHHTEVVNAFHRDEMGGRLVVTERVIES